MSDDIAQSQTDLKPLELFPEFEQFARDTSLVEKAKGYLAAKLPRILGQGSTKAIGFDAPPAPVERMIEYISLKQRSDIQLPPAVLEELDAIELSVKQLKTELAKNEGFRRLAARTLERIDAEKGFKDGFYFVDRLLLTSEKGGMEWAWSVTPHYSIVRKLPPDADYLANAFRAAQDWIANASLSTSDFQDRLALAWSMARHFSKSDDVLITDVMRLFKVAGQPEKFWQNPSRQTFAEMPEATFVVNLIQWRSSAQASAGDFEFVPATLYQTNSSKSNVFYLPMNREGTEVRPMMYLRRRS